MRRAAIVGGIGAVLVILLAATNPSKPEYVDWLKGQVSAQASGNVITLGLTALLGGVVIDSATTRQDFVLFSVFRTSIGGNSMTVLGILHHFILIQGASASTNTAAFNGGFGGHTPPSDMSLQSARDNKAQVHAEIDQAAFRLKAAVQRVQANMKTDSFQLAMQSFQRDIAEGQAALDQTYRDEQKVLQQVKEASRSFPKNCAPHNSTCLKGFVTL